MPRSRITRGKLRAEIVTNGLIASARNLNVKTLPLKKVKRSEWQEEAWHSYDTVEVFHYAVTWVGNMLSRAKLTVLENGKPTKNQAALDALESFFGGSSNHSEFLRQAAIHMTVAGEAYLIGRDSDSDDEWDVAAAVSVKIGPSGYKVEGEDIDSNTTFVMRLWRPHPRLSNMPDSAVRPLLPILSIINEITMYTSAQLESRLASAGVLMLPSSATFPTSEMDGEKSAQVAGVGGFIQELAEIAALRKTNRGDASSVVPLIIQADGEDIDKIKHVTFWSELDAATSEREAAAIRRLALGLDMPSEQLTGTGEVNHWGAWQIDDAAIKAHAEPLLEIITAAVTSGYLRVVLEEGGMTAEDAQTFEIGSDTAEMRLRPDRSKESVEMYDRGELSGAAMLRENGFHEDDAMDEDEQKLWIMRKLAQGSPSPELVQAAVEALGIEIKVVDATTSEAPARGERPLPRSLEEHPTRDIPNPDDSEAQASLLATSEALVFRVLERCGNRMLTVKPAIEGLPRDVDKMDLYLYAAMSKLQLDHVMSDAWASIGRYTLTGTDAGTLETHLDNYVRMLITNRQRYDRQVLRNYINLILGGQ